MRNRKRPPLKESFQKAEERNNQFKKNLKNKCYNKNKQQRDNNNNNKPTLESANSLNEELYLDLSLFTQGLILL
jgi:hypothetical protein